MRAGGVQRGAGERKEKKVGKVDVGAAGADVFDSGRPKRCINALEDVLGYRVICGPGIDKIGLSFAFASVLGIIYNTEMPVDSLPLKYEHWATADEDEKPAKGQNKRGEVVNMIKAGLRVCNVWQNMEYKKYREVIQAGMGIQIVGWSEGTPFAASTIGTGGASALDVLWERLKMKVCHWEDMPAGEHEAALLEFPKKRKNYESMWKPKRDAVKAAEAKELTDAAKEKRQAKKCKQEENAKASGDGGDGGDGGKEELPKKKKAKTSGSGGGEEPAGGGGDGGEEKEQKKQKKKEEKRKKKEAEKQKQKEEKQKKKEEEKKRKEAKRSLKVRFEDEDKDKEGGMEGSCRRRRTGSARQWRLRKEREEEEEEPPKRPAPRPRTRNQPKSKATISDSDEESTSTNSTPVPVDLKPATLEAFLKRTDIPAHAHSFYELKLKSILALQESEAAKAQMAAAAAEAGPSNSNKGKGTGKAKAAPRKLSTIGNDSDSYEDELLMDHEGSDIELHISD
ncbi:hypothetical protein B0H13DRAFT_1871015 [Mycena leptocephala]|nr:hypothetical protein B0H13DRAFT_1871015 [Mycena leptocephala]